MGFEHGGHDMQPRSDDRFLLHLAAWLESIEDDDTPDPELDLKIVDNMRKMEQNEAMIRALREKLGL